VEQPDFTSDSIYRTIAADDLQSAKQNTKLENWAAGLLECAKAFSLTLPSGEMQLVSMQHVTAAAMAAATADRQSHDTYDPRTAPSKGAQQYTYQAWFSRPSWAVGPSFGSCSCQFHNFIRSCVSDLDRTTCPLKLARCRGRRCRDSSAHASFVTRAQLVMISTCSWSVPPQMAHAPPFLRYSHSSPSHQCNSSCGKETE